MGKETVYRILSWDGFSAQKDDSSGGNRIEERPEKVTETRIGIGGIGTARAVLEGRGVVPRPFCRSAWCTRSRPQKE